MTVVELPQRPAVPDITRSTVGPGRRARNGAASLLVYAAVVVAFVPLAFVVVYVVRKGAGIIDWDFLSQPIPTTRSLGPGMGPAVMGTLIITGAATAVSVPLGILAAIYLNEYGRASRLASLLRLLADVMAGVPSIVMGLFVYTVWVLRYGLSAFAGALALACLMLPIVIRSTEAMLKLVPTDLREASAALGCRRSRTILTVVLPAALPGITSGCLLAVARAAGETAPLLFTIGAIFGFNNSLFHGANTSLSVQIFANAQQPYPGAQARAWGAALTLIVLVLVLTVVARVVSSRLSVKAR